LALPAQHRQSKFMRACPSAFESASLTFCVQEMSRHD
jgi:hypothetical protein